MAIPPLVELATEWCGNNLEYMCSASIKPTTPSLFPHKLVGDVQIAVEVEAGGMVGASAYSADSST